MVRKHTNTSRPRSFMPLRIFAKALTGLSKNMTPKREYTRSTGPARSHMSSHPPERSLRCQVPPRRYGPWLSRAWRRDIDAQYGT